MDGRFGDLITAMVTPFDEDGNVDYGEAQKLAAWLLDNGSDGVVVAGSTGEASTLTDQEQRNLWKAVKEAVGDRTKIVAGTGSNDTSHAIELTRWAEEDGLDGALVVTPYYNKPPQSGLLAHFKAIAASTSLPLILYDIPARSVIKIEHSTILELAQVENIVALKDAAGSVQGAARLVADAPEGFQIYSGNDADTLPWLSVGAVGVIAVASHVAGPQMAEMIRLYKSGDPEGARKVHLDLMPVFDAMGLTTNPIPVKACMELMGHRVGGPRLPLIPATAEQRERLQAVLTSAGVL
ncbi:MAG TPA: 4-hydroxy-tetrahydrodipicolinate synthase [Actinomycetota bacterium]|nr:4-hydroxy-tetrahydrodipicolinate synthase [Actinomycetota bacterium]